MTFRPGMRQRGPLVYVALSLNPSWWSLSYWRNGMDLTVNAGPLRLEVVNG